MKVRLLPILLLLLAPGCIEASRPAGSGGDTRDAVGADDGAEVADGAGADTADTATASDTTASCRADQCRIDGACYADGATRAGAPCFVCDLASAPGAWSHRDTGAACDDGDACTPTSVCSGDGRCVGEPDPTCSDPPACVTEASCDDDGCDYVLEADTCLIDGACHAAGDAADGAPCASCVPERDRFAWTLRTSGPCDDSDACTKDDVCGDGGTCAGVALVCDDGVSCTVDSCEEGHCTYVVDASSCYIDEACRSEGEVSDSVVCGVCDPAASRTDWSPSTGGSCDDGDVCTGGDRCDAGSCAGELIRVDSEPNDTAGTFDLLATGTVDLEATFPSGALDGNLNPTETDEDYFGYGMLMNLNAVKRKPKIRLSNLDDTAAYEVCIWARCGVSDMNARVPAVSCPIGSPVTLEGSFVGCCTTLAGAEYAGTLQASCADDESSTDVGLVRVRVRAAGQNGAACPSYRLEWGATSY